MARRAFALCMEEGETMKWIEIPKEESKQREKLDWLNEELERINQERMDLILEIEALERALAKPYLYRLSTDETTTRMQFRYPTSRIRRELLPS